MTNIPHWQLWTADLIAAAVCVSSLEFLFLHREFEAGIYAERIVRSRPVNYLFQASSALHALFYGARLAIIAAVVRLFSAAALLASSFTGHLSVVALLLVAGSSVFLSHRNLIGGDGSDQMSTLILIALIPAVSLPNDFLVNMICAWFIALQSCLSYLTAGVAKAISVHWRTGLCLAPILRTKAYGHNGMAAFIEQAGKWRAPICWTIISFELCFPLVLFGCKPIVLAFISAGILFHATNSVAMGLNCFFWAFLASYPSILWVTHSTALF